LITLNKKLPEFKIQTEETLLAMVVEKAVSYKKHG